MPDLSIIIAICNTDYPPAHYTGDCIGSIKYFTKTPYEIILIDNASTIELGGVDWNKSVDKYVRNETNMGVPHAWNQGIGLAEGKYVAIINSDVQVYNLWDKLLIQDLEVADVVMATPMYDDPLGRAKESLDRYTQNKNEDYLDGFADFSCFMVKSKLFDKVGLFDENYGYGYGEDVDFRKRVEAIGGICRSDKRVATHHIGMATGYTLMNQGIKINEQMDTNKEYTEKKHSEHKDADKVVFRTNKSGDKVYYMEDGAAEYHWVKNPETLYQLGFSFDDVVAVDAELIASFKEGAPHDLKEEYLLKQKEEAKVYEVNKILGYRENA